MLAGLPQFTSAPTSYQFAKDGAWESAWSFPSDRLPSHAELAAYLEQSTEVAFEAFFGSAFFGARMVGSALEVETFGIKCLQAARAREASFTSLHRELGCPVPGQRPAFVEVGCVNAWRSIGALRISEPQLASVGFEQLLQLVFESPAVQDTRHPKAIEFAFDAPVPHWFGLPISTPGTPHPVSLALLRQAMELGAPQVSQT
ncbi:hypothetical protein [Hydrogenophaga aquatica]